MKTMILTSNTLRPLSYFVDFVLIFVCKNSTSCKVIVNIDDRCDLIKSTNKLLQYQFITQLHIIINSLQFLP